MKRVRVEVEPRPLKTTKMFKIFNRELGNKSGMLDQYSEYYFIRKIQLYNDSYYMAELIRYHIGFVIVVARQMWSPFVSFEDLVNEGIIGLIKASQKYDDTRGAKFLSYAVWYIKAYMLQSVAENYELIRLPANQFNFMFEVKDKIEALRKATGEDYTHRYADVAWELEVPVDQVSNIINAPTRARIITFDEPHKRYTDSDTLIDVSFSIGGSYSFEEVEKTYDDELRTESLRSEIFRSLSTLTERESDIIRLFFGIEVSTVKNLPNQFIDRRDLDLEEIGEVYGLTRERIRQIKEKAIRRLRHTSRSKQLRTYLG